MENNIENNQILSISMLCQREYKLTECERIDYLEFNSLVKQLSKFIPSFSDNAICKCYRINKRSKPYNTVIVPSELVSGLIYYDFIFDKSDQYQKNLLLQSTELNKALFEYIESALTVIYAEQSLSSKDIQLDYQFKKSLKSTIEIKDNVIQYGIRTFPTFVKSFAKLMKELFRLNPDYCVLFCSDNNHVFAEGIETYSSPVPIESNEIFEFTGRAVPIYKSAELDCYVFIEHHTGSKYTLSLSEDVFCEILDRAAKYRDPIKIMAKRIEYKDRDKILRKKDLRLHKIITVTRESREALAQSLIPNLLFKVS